jgi:hypothetical protein
MSDVPADEGRPGWPTSDRPRNGMGTAALVLGIVGLVLALIVVGGLPGLIAVVLGVVGLLRVRRGEANNRGVAIAGIVTGALAIVVAVVVGVFLAENADEIEDLGDCLEDADTEQQRDDCANRFEDELDPDN